VCRPEREPQPRSPLATGSRRMRLPVAANTAFRAAAATGATGCSPAPSGRGAPAIVYVSIVGVSDSRRMG